MQEAKKLTNDKGEFVTTFEACGNKYHILPIEKAINAVRYYKYEELQAKYRFDASPESVAAQLKEANTILEKLINREKQEKNVFHAVSILQAIIDKVTQPNPMNRSRLHFMFLICTLFIVREGEVLTEWSEEDAQRKIDDWVNDGYGFLDFFGLAAKLINELNAALIESMELG